MHACAIMHVQELFTNFTQLDTVYKDIMWKIAWLKSKQKNYKTSGTGTNTFSSTKVCCAVNINETTFFICTNRFSGLFSHKEEHHTSCALPIELCNGWCMGHLTYAKHLLVNFTGRISGSLNTVCIWERGEVILVHEKGKTHLVKTTWLSDPWWLHMTAVGIYYHPHKTM